MAEAMRQVSVRRGYDPGDYALLAFGGAGGQHACAVAGLLGVRTIVVPRDAGLLSALGLGEARLERFAERQVLRPLDEVAGALPALLAELEAEAAAAVAAEGISIETVEVRRRILGLRLAGQDSVLAVEHSAGVPPGAAFVAAYEALYGYPPPARGVEVESLRVVAASRPPETSPPAPVVTGAEAAADSWRPACVGGSWREVPCFRRESLIPGQRLPSPALVFERHGATLVDAGWAAAVDAAGALVLRREEDR
jgi:5-oxoprolinase (ATP-hydrolysing)